MYAVPDVNQVITVAAELGIQLSPAEATLYQEQLQEQLKSLDEFVQSPIAETRPPLLFPAREPGYRPDTNEDPLSAWLWKCSIGGADQGLLAGKSVSYKDHIAVAGIPLTFGSFPMEGFVPDFDATVVTRVLAAGGTVVGKNTMNGLTGGFGFGGAIGDYGRPKNPHNVDHVTGGSSSGSAAAVVTGQTDISFGGDQGGSIRIPAAFSGCVGLKPTFGLVSHFGVGFGSDQSIDYTGPMARTSKDVALAMQAVMGPDGYDPRQTRDVPQSADLVGGLDQGIAGLRIAVVEEGFANAEPGVADAVNAAADILAQAGATITKVSIPEHLLARHAQQALGAEGGRAIFQSGFFGMFSRTYYPASLIAAINKLYDGEADLLNPRTKLTFLLGEFARRNYHGRVYAKAQNVRPTFIQAYDRALAEADVLLMPTCVVTAPKYEPPTEYLDVLADNLRMNLAATQNTQPLNYTGHPALAVPCGKSEGLPVSMQLIGKFFDDGLLLRVGHAFEQAAPYDEIVSVAA